MNIGNHGRGCGHSCCLRIQDMSIKIGNSTILENISLHAHCGEIITIIGPNGAGKSTLLKAILGQKEHSGVISFSVPGQRNRKPIIGYVPQSPTFDPGDPLTVADLFGCCMSKLPAFFGLSKKMRNLVSECLSRVDAKDLIDKRVGTLSGGELQRVLLALALEPIPNILILDEPLSGVDVEGMDILMELLSDIRQEYDLSTQEGRTEYARACAPYLKHLDPLDLENRLQELMTRTGFPRETLLAQIGQQVEHLRIHRSILVQQVDFHLMLQLPQYFRRFFTSGGIAIKAQVFFPAVFILLSNGILNTQYGIARNK